MLEMRVEGGGSGTVTHLVYIIVFGHDDEGATKGGGTVKFMRHVHINPVPQLN